MPSKISQNQIVEAIMDGIEKAQKTYKEWSGGDWLNRTAEHVMNGFIARSIMEIPGSKYLEIEPRTKETIKAADANRRGKLAQELRPQGHIDMCLWGANNSPRAVIEIKHNLYNYYGQCKGDIDRIQSSLRSPNTSLQFGVFAFYSSVDGGRVTAKEKLERIFNRTKKRIEADYGKSFKVSGNQRVHEDGDSAWAASYIILNKKRTP